MFRARFADAFPQKLSHFGPQDIERGVVDSAPSPHVESLLCALLGLVLNRKKPVEYVLQCAGKCRERYIYDLIPVEMIVANDCDAQAWTLRPGDGGCSVLTKISVAPVVAGRQPNIRWKDF